MRLFVAWLIGPCLVPLIALLHFGLADGLEPLATRTLGFALQFVWPSIAAWTLLALPLFSLRGKPTVPVAVCAIAAISALATAFIAPHFYPEVGGRELRLAGRILLDTLFCFGASWYIALGPHRPPPRPAPASNGSAGA